MSIKILRNSLAALVAIVLIGVGAHAAVKGDQTPAMTYGAVQVATASATAIPNMNGANAVLVQNLGPNAIYCGSDSSVTTSTGVQVPANGGVLTFDIVQAGSGAIGSTATVAPALYCRAATALQVTPADTRYARVK